MYELIPILAGAATGLIAGRWPSRRAQAVAITLVAPLAALLVGVVSGELADSWAFLLWDLAQAVGAFSVARLVALGARRTYADRDRLRYR